MVKLESGSEAAESETVNCLEEILDQRTKQLQEFQSADSQKERCIEGLKMELDSGARVEGSDAIARLEENLGQRTDQIQELQIVKTTEGLKQEDIRQEAQYFTDAEQDSNRHTIIDLLSCLLGKHCPI